MGGCDNIIVYWHSLSDFSLLNHSSGRLGAAGTTAHMCHRDLQGRELSSGKNIIFAHTLYLSKAKYWQASDWKCT